MFAITKALRVRRRRPRGGEKFYGQTLGLRTSEQYGLLTLHLAGGRDTLVYPKPDHVPASSVNFQVDDIDAAVGELASRGVPMERYDGLDRTSKASTGPGALHRLVQGPGEHPGGAAGALAQPGRRPGRVPRRRGG